jgi:signal transduction histidine kinase
MSKFVGKIKSSIFTKLLLVIIMTGIIVIALIGGFLKYYTHKMKPPFQKNAIYYTNYIIREIGTPPDTIKALEISQDLSLQIRFESPDFKWTTNEKLISFKNFDKKNSYENENIKIDFDEGVYYLTLQQDSWRYLFAFDFRESADSSELLSVFLIFLLTLVFTAAYLLIKRILKQINLLNEGVKQVAGGNLKYQVAVTNPDELGKLSESFNSMTRRIGEMIRSKERLLLDVSHELRSPLTRIKVALEFVEESQSKESVKEDISDVEKMITEILETERLNSDHGKLILTKTNVLELIKEVCRDLQNKHPGIKPASVPESVFLNIDSDRIKTVLKNVLENSLKYSKPESLPVEISINDKEKSLVIIIKDNGFGIAEEELPFIFDPFYRVDKSRSKETGGYGLGMSLCKKIMEAHGGSIEIKSELNAGTTVYLKFTRYINYAAHS